MGHPVVRLHIEHTSWVDHPPPRSTNSYDMVMAADLLYHYTSFSAFQKIIESKSIWATHVKYLNDSEEFSHAFSLAEKYIDEHLVNASQGDTTLGRAIKSSFSSRPITACVASFSEESDALSQWRAYSHGGVGVCIGFRATLFQKIIEAHQDSSERLMQCIYEEKEKRLEIERLLREPIKTMHDGVWRSSNDRMAQCVSDLVVPLILNAPRFKHEAFKSEKEWRFVRHAVEQASIGLKATPWEFRANDSYLIPYTGVDLSEVEPLELTEVIVGPNPHSYDAVRSTEMCLASAGVKCGSVRSSNAPFRFW